MNRNSSTLVLILIAILCLLMPKAKGQDSTTLATFTTGYGKIYPLYYDSAKHKLYYWRKPGVKFYLRRKLKKKV